jgi:hypothetical protein
VLEVCEAGHKFRMKNSIEESWDGEDETDEWA